MNDFKDSDFDISQHNIIKETSVGKKPLMGRPKLKATEKKNKRIVANLTSSEYNELINILGRDVKPSTWARNIILDYIKKHK